MSIAGLLYAAKQKPAIGLSDMRKKDRDAYLDAMVEEACRMTNGAKYPVVLDCYRFFSSATRKAKLAHGFDPRDCRRIMGKFGDAFINRAAGEQLLIFKISRDMVTHVGHGNQAIVDDAEQTKENFRTRAGLEKGAEGFAIFPEGCAVGKHPLLQSRMKRDGRYVKTRLNNYQRKCTEAISRGLLGKDDIEPLGPLGLPAPK